MGGFVKPVYENMDKIKLGDKVCSSVSGFSGTITAKCEYLHSVAQYCVTAKCKDNDIKEAWFAASELELVEE